MRAGRVVELLASVVALTLLEPTASAHHVASDAGITPAKPRTLVEIAGDTGALVQGAHRGSYLRTSPAIEVVLGRRFSLRAQGALVFVERDGGGSASGLGDTEVSVKANLLAGEHGGPLISVGLGGKLPTGDLTLGLGGGHYGLAPFIAASYERERDAVTLVAAAMAVHVLALGEEAHAHGLVIDPHAPQELQATATLAAVAREAWASLGTASAWSVEPADGLGWLSGRLTVGGLLGAKARVLASFEAPFAGDPGWRWRGSLGVAYVH